MTTSQRNGTELGPQICFVEVDTVGIMSGSTPRGWVRSLGRDKETLVKEKWVYAFRVEADGRCRFAAEIETDKEGRLRYLLDPSRVTTKPENAKPFSPWGDGVSLPTTIQGAALSYFFVTSRVRLGPKSLRDLTRLGVYHGEFGSLASDGDVYLPLLDLSQRDGVVADNGGKPLKVAVIDFLRIAENLHAFYAKALREYALYAEPYTESGQANLEVVGRILRRQLAELVRDLVRKRPELTTKLSDNGSGLYQAIDAIDKETAKLKLARERAAGALCVFLGSPYLGTVFSWHEEAGDDATVAFVEVLARVEHDLEYSARGAQWAMAPGPTTKKVLKNWVFPKLEPALDMKKRVSLSKKGAAPVAYIFSKYLPWYLKELFDVAQGSKLAPAINKGLQEALDFLNEILEARAFFLSPASEDGIRKVSACFRARNANTFLNPEAAKEVSAVLDALTANQLKVNLKNAKGAFEKKWISGIGAPIDTIYRALDAINNTWKIVAFLSMDMSLDKKTGLAFADALGGTAGLLKNFWFDIALSQAKQTASMLKAAGEEALIEVVATNVRTVARLGKAVVWCTWLGVIGDIASAYKDGEAAWNSADYESMVATGIGGAAGVAYAILTALSAATPLLLGLLAVQGVAFAAAGWLKDADIENFVEHCSFGSRHLQQNGLISGIHIPYEEWKGDPEGLYKQLKVLSALLSKFNVQAVHEAGISITLGRIDHGVSAHVVYVDDRMDAPCQIDVALDNGRVTKHGSVPSGFSLKLAPPPSSGRFPRTVTFEFRHAQDRLDTKSSACRIYLSHDFPFTPVDAQGAKEKPLRYLVPACPVPLSDSEERKYGPFPSSLLLGEPDEAKGPGVQYVIRGGKAGFNGEIKASAGG